MSDISATPRLVLVHGTRMDARQWDPYRPLLPGIEVVAVDLPGHGSRLGERFTADAAVSAIAAAVEGAGGATPVGSRPPDRRVVLAGHSLGGYMATLYAARRPGHLDALVLIGATADPGSPLKGVYRGFARAVPRLGADRAARGANRVMRWLGARGEMAEQLPGGEAYAALPDAWREVMDECRPELLADVRCPVLIVNGQLDQMRVHVRRYLAAAQDVRVVTVPRATHLLPVTHPGELAALLREATAPGSRPGQLPTMGA